MFWRKKRTFEEKKKFKLVLRREDSLFLLSQARALHPKEFISLLRGKVKKDENIVYVSEVIVPPLATYGHGFSTYNPYLMPIIADIVGTAHSHPSGARLPSFEDLRNFIGYALLIVCYPYESSEDIYAYDSRGRNVEMEIS